MTEVKRMIVIQSVIDKKRTGKEASEVLKVSERQIWRLIKKARDKGIVEIKHGNCNRIPKNKTPEDVVNKVIQLKKSYNYELANFKHFTELLEEKENIKLSYSTVYNILKENGFVSKNSHKERITHRRRKRKEHEGDLVQADGTPFEWFEDNQKYSIHGFIDDATGQVLGLYMMKNECLLGYLEALRYMLKNYGVPKVIYPDKYSVFFPATKQKLTIEEELQGKKFPTTQFMDIISALGINMYPASTSQDKGRIKRLWKTLQDRLITEFRINNIKTPEQANEFFIKFIPKYNKKFAVEAASPISHFSDVPDYINLDLLLSAKLKRVIDNSGTFTIQGKKFQIVNNKILPNVKVDIYINKKRGIIVRHNNIEYNVLCGDDVPNKYSSITANQLYKENNAKVVEFAINLLTYDSKSNQPLLVSS